MNFDFNLFISLFTGILLPLVVTLATVLITRGIEKSKNVVSVTTNTRIQRNEKLKEAGILLLSNTDPRLLSGNFDNKTDLLVNAVHASDTIGVILHRNYENDMVLIDLSKKICSLAFQIAESAQNEEESTALEDSTNRLRQYFSVELDLYTNTEWYRIKRETCGKETASKDWFELNKKLKASYPAECWPSEKE